MKKTFFLWVLALFIQQSFSQIVVTKLPDSTTYWTKTNKVGFDISQVSFVNWNAGGNNSISGLLKGQAVRKYERKNFTWNNEMILRYGINKQEGQELRKTDDQIQVNSTAGFRTDSTSNWYYGGKFTFNTQFANGYNYPNTEDAISRFFAPAYVFLGIGTEYVRKDIKFNLYLSPLTQKTTLVLDQTLANQGAFGVTAAVYDPVTGELIRHGKKTRTELGALVTSQWEKEVYKNINLENRLSLYTDYINNFGNIDIDWQLQLDMTVNQYVKANINTHLLYDDDIKAKEEIDGEQVTVGPKVQLKQILGVGISYTF